MVRADVTGTSTSSKISTELFISSSFLSFFEVPDRYDRWFVQVVSSSGGGSSSTNLSSGSLKLRLSKSGGTNSGRHIVCIISSDGLYFKPGAAPTQEPQYFLMERIGAVSEREKGEKGEREKREKGEREEEDLEGEVRLAYCGSDPSHTSKPAEWLRADHKGDIIEGTSTTSTTISSGEEVWELQRCSETLWDHSNQVLLSTIKNRLSLKVGEQLQSLLAHNSVPVHIDGDGIVDYSATACPSCGHAGHIARDCAYYNVP